MTANRTIAMCFSGEMVRAIGDGRKTVTRRPIKQIGNAPGIGFVCKHGSDNSADWVKCCSPYHVGDEIWVRETFSHDHNFHGRPVTWYRADSTDWGNGPMYWTPSIHMRREFSRLSLSIVSIRAERLQEITPEQAKMEGAPEMSGFPVFYDRGIQCYVDWFQQLWDSIYAAPRPVRSRGIITHYVSYPWQDIQETREYKGKPWRVYGNPWVWRGEWERVINSVGKAV